MTRDSVARMSLVLCLASAGMLVPAIVGAQDGAATYPPCQREPTDADVEGAKGAHKAATQFFERGNYDRAIQYWNDAYEFDCTKPALLLNIANAHEKAGDTKAAVSTLEVFLERAPEAEDAETVRAKVKNLKASLAPAPTSAPTAQPTSTGEPPPPPPPPAPEGERPYGFIPWIVAGGGLAVSIGGLIPLLIGQGKIDDAEAQCPSHNNCSADVKATGDSGNGLRLAGSIILPVGLLAVGGGLVWQFVFNQPAPATATGITVVPRAGPDSAGLVVGGSF